MTTRALFLDARVPDLQKLIDGAAPGEAVFVLDPAQDGLAQIVADLAGANLSHLASIAIVSHGATGSLQLGSTMLDDDALGAHKAALRAIGAALRHKGQLDLYACDVAAGAAGRRFVADLSHYAGGAHVAASTHTIGRTAAGESWTLDASAGAKAAPAASPFKSAATDAYQGPLAIGPTGQLYGLGNALHSDKTTGDVTNYFGSFSLNAGSTTPTIYDNAVNTAVSLAVDPVLGIRFTLSTYADSTGTYEVPFTSNLNTGSTPVAAQSFVAFDKSIGAVFGQGSQTLPGEGIAVDTLNHKIYAFEGSGDTDSKNGMIVADYSVDSSGNVTVGTPKFVETSTANTAPSFFNNGAAYFNNNVYVADVDQNDTSVEDGIYRIGTNGTAPVSILNNSTLTQAGLGGGQKDRINYGIAIDHAADRLFFATSTPNPLGSSTNYKGKLYALNNIDTTSNQTPTALTFASGVTSPTFKDIKGIAYDENAHVLYVANDDDDDPSNSQIDELTLGNSQNPTQVTAVTVITYSRFSNNAPDNAPFYALAFTPLSTLTVNGTAAAVAKGTPTTLLSGTPTITDITSGGFEKSVTVSITDNGTAVSGDVLGFNEGGTFTAVSSNAASPTMLTDHGHTFAAYYSGGVLTIANKDGASASENTIGSYTQVLQDVQYQNNSTDAHTRLVTVQVNNGVLGTPSGPTNTKSFSVTLAQPPVIAPGGYNVPGYVLAGASVGATTPPGALAGDSDPNGGTLSITAVQTAGGTMGALGSALAGTYGSLTLQANGTYSYSASNAAAIANAATGSHPVDSYSFTVTNAGGSVPEAFKATIDRAPTGTGIIVSATEGTTASGASTAAFAHETDADGDALSVASISYTNPTTTVTTNGTVGQSIAGTYGELTLNANGSYSYVVDQTAAYNAARLAGTQPVDRFTYTSSDGLGGATGPQTLEFDVTCFVSGTRIRTVRGDIAVEALAVGDLAVTASGALKAIRWLDHREVGCAAYADPRRAWPVRIRAGAFGDGLPVRDLCVSPDHAIRIGPEHGLADGPVLVPAFALINGATIVREPVASVVYWHVELEGGHDILLAAGLATESYLDCGNRGFFAGADKPMDPGLDAADACMARTDDADRLAPVRSRLRDRALALGWTLAADPLGGVRLIADGQSLVPESDGLSVRFVLPVAARDVWLVSGSAIPWEVSDVGDARRLGLCVSALSLDDGLSPRCTVALDDPCLDEGFHALEPNGGAKLRWTDGRARLPHALWADLRGVAFVRLDLRRSCLPVWRAPPGLLAGAAEGGGHLRPLAANA